MPRALVTGASGFIGGHLVEALLAGGQDVRAVVRRTSRTNHLESLGVELVCGDLSDPASLVAATADVDTVYHLAARTHAIHRSTLMEVNGQGTEAVASACAGQPRPPTLVVVSSIAAAGPVRRGQVRDETQPAEPVSNYGESKRAGELAAERWADRVPTTIVRPGIVFGPRDAEVLRAMKMIRRFRIHPIPGFNPPPLSLVHVEPLVATLIRAAERGSRVDPQGSTAGQGYYFSCAAEHPTYGELGRLLADAIDCRTVLPLPLPTPLAWLLAGTNQILHRIVGGSDLFNLDKMREARMPSWACSGERAQRELGLEPGEPIGALLRRTADWYRRAGRL